MRDPCSICKGFVEIRLGLINPKPKSNVLNHDRPDSKVGRSGFSDLEGTL